MSAQLIINKWLQDTQKELVRNYDRLGLRASGKWADSLESFYSQQKGNIKAGILGESYTEQLENGRRPNQKSSEEEIRKWVGWAGNTIIKDWVEDKGLDLNPFAVAYKIAREGWNVPNKHNKGGLVTDVVTDERIDELNNKLALFYIGEIRSDIKKTFE